MDNFVIENKSNATQEFVEIFKNSTKNLNKKIVKLINSKNLQIILANKLSDILLPENINDIDTYQDYTSENKDLTTRGLLSDTINALCIFSNTTTKENLEAIFYHELGHLIDMHADWEKPSFSNTAKFVEAYQKDIQNSWDKIKNDNRYRLKHYIQNSTPENISLNATMETFAHCFARINGKFDDIDILGEYFPETLKIAKKIFAEFLEE